MFNVGATELILILVIAFVVVGPKDLPKIARALGRFVRGIRQMMEEVKRETGVDELEKEFKDIKRDLNTTARSVQKDIDDVGKDLKKADIRPDLQKAGQELNKEIKDAGKDIKK